jgi:hypothetical protein
MFKDIIQNRYNVNVWQSRTVVSLTSTIFNIKKFCALSTGYINVFCVDCRKKIISLYSTDGLVYILIRNVFTAR